MLNITLVGASGRMGMQIVSQIASKPHYYHLSNAIVRNASTINKEILQLTSIVIEDIQISTPSDVVIDFSNPSASMLSLTYCVEYKIPLVIGATGFSAKDKLLIEQASKHIAIFMTSNFSLSVNVLFNLTKTVASSLINFEAEIIERHHRYKKDAPSGTALTLGEIIAASRNIDFVSHAKFTRYGNDEKRDSNDIGFAVVRGGDIVGQHDVSFINDNETLTLSSSITNRACFAHGALIAAAFIINKEPGIYNMSDVLKL